MILKQSSKNMFQYSSSITALEPFMGLASLQPKGLQQIDFYYNFNILTCNQTLESITSLY